MKKQLLAAAVAAAVAAPMAATAGDVTLYGVVHMSVDSMDYDTGRAGTFGGTGATGMDAEVAGFDGLSVNSPYTRFGIKGTEDLGNGLSAFFQMEFLIDGDDDDTTGDVRNNRNTFVGLAGNWGKVGIGRNDSPYKKSTGSLELFGTQIGDYNDIYFDDLRMEDTVFYYSPNWNGFSFGAAIGMPSSDTGSDGADSDGVEVVSIAGTYKNGPFFASLGFESEEEEAADTGAEDYDKWRLGLGYTANGYHVGFIYEDGDDADGTDGADEEIWQISGSYTFGNNVLKAAYGKADLDATDTDPDMWSIGLDHKLSKRTKVYAVYGEHDDDAGDAGGDDVSALSFGIVHKF